MCVSFLICFLFCVCVCVRDTRRTCSFLKTSIATVWNNSLKIICDEGGSICTFISNVKTNLIFVPVNLI